MPPRWAASSASIHKGIRNCNFPFNKIKSLGCRAVPPEAPSDDMDAACTDLVLKGLRLISHGGGKTTEH